MAMKVLITGGAGFIGSNYVYSHLDARPEDEITVLDALVYGSNFGLLEDAIARGLKFVEGRIEDVDLIRGLFESEQFDIVVHFAAETHVDHSIEAAGKFVKSNVQGTQVLLDAARDFGVKHFQHISTDEVYGDFALDSEEKFTETSPLKPSNPYSATKCASDLLALSYWRTHGVPVCVSRCSNNYGPHQALDKFIPLFSTKAAAGENLPLYGSGENIRDWLHVKDHCDAILMLIEKGRHGEVYNIGADNELSNLQVAKMILAELDKPESLITFVEDRKGHDLRYAMGYEKLNKEFGWKPSRSFEEGLRETINWYTLKSYERSHSSRRNGIETGATDASHEQASASHLR